MYFFLTSFWWVIRLCRPRHLKLRLTGGGDSREATELCWRKVEQHPRPFERRGGWRLPRWQDLRKRVACSPKTLEIGNAQMTISMCINIILQIHCLMEYFFCGRDFRDNLRINLINSPLSLKSFKWLATEVAAFIVDLEKCKQLYCFNAFYEKLGL